MVTATWESEPQGEPMGLWVEDGGKSECLPVAGRRGVESEGCAVSTADRVYHPTRKRARTERSTLPTQVARHEKVWRTTFKRESK